MKKIITLPIILVILLCVPRLNNISAQDTLVIPALKDNTLFEEDDLSNARGHFLFVGKTNLDKLRRAVIAFDIAGNIPAEAMIESVELTLHLSRTGSSSSPIFLHELMRDWGEGTSDALAQEGKGAAATEGDATWMHTFYDTGTWSHPGGDYDTTILAVTDVNSFGDYTWGSASGMVDNVQTWLDEPDENFGWILVGQEDETHDAKRFDSRELDYEPFRPRLKVVYSASVTDKGTVNNFQGIAGIRAYPNPFSEYISIEYTLNQGSQVEIKIMNILGQEVMTLVSEYQSIGTHSATWDGSHASGKNLKNGIYYSYIRVGRDISVLKIMKTQ